MKKEKNSLALILMLALLALPMLQGCKVPDNAGAIVENILVSMNEENYKNFSQDFSDGMKAKLPEADFAGFLGATKGILGDYEENSKQLVNFVTNAGAYILIYSANFSKQGQQSVMVYLYNNKIVGLVINSFSVMGG